MGEQYPERESLYCLHFIKWLIESGAVNECGPDAFALLVAVVMLEDELRYSRPPNLFNEQLCRRCGIASIPALIRARTRAVQLGLLRYQPATKRRPGVYFTTGFPNESLRKAEGIRKESDRNPSPSTPSSFPNKNKKRPQFKKPTLEEVKAYCQQRHSSVNPEYFHDYYTANGWVQGKGKPLRDWKATVRNWERNGVNQQTTAKTDPAHRPHPARRVPK